MRGDNPLRRFQIKTLLLLLIFLSSQLAAVPYQTRDLVFMQSYWDIRERIGDDAFIAYSRALNVSAAQVFEAAPILPERSGFIVVAVRPQGRSKVWLDIEPALPKDPEGKLISALEATPAAASRGLAYFALA
jgi:hypothetical protein